MNIINAPYFKFATYGCCQYLLTTKTLERIDDWYLCGRSLLDVYGHNLVTSASIGLLIKDDRYIPSSSKFNLGAAKRSVIKLAASKLGIQIPNRCPCKC